MLLRGQKWVTWVRMLHLGRGEKQWRVMKINCSLKCLQDQWCVRFSQAGMLACPALFTDVEEPIWLSVNCLLGLNNKTIIWVGFLNETTGDLILDKIELL